MEQEIWKDIKGLEGRYQISSLGKVRSLPKSVIFNGEGNLLSRKNTKTNRR